MLNSQFLDRGPVFPILQKSNMEVVQASLNSSLRVWQILLGSVAECWLTAQIMNQTAQAAIPPQPRRILCVRPCRCLTPSKSSCPAASGLAAPSITASWALCGAAAEGGGSKCPGVCPQLLQSSPWLLQSTAQDLSQRSAAAFIGTSEKTRTCAPHLSDSLCWLKLVAFLEIITASGNYYN